jgi:hypothetical protein
MASILDKYGIKEVADVVFYELDSKGAPSAPVLYLDTLKVSTIEQSAEVVDATGGKGNVKLISWDTNKEVTATFEDALFSVKSLAIMFGGQVTDNGSNQEVLKTLPFNVLINKTDDWGFMLNGKEFRINKDAATYFKYVKSEVVPTTKTDTATDFITFDLLDAKTVGENDATGADITMNGLEIEIDASTFGGTYYITGDTYARDYVSGKDEFLQFIIPKGKVSSEDLSLTMEADGDPATFTMNINALKAADGSVFKLVKYTISGAEGSNKNKGVASVLGEYDEENTENAGYSTNPAASKVPAGSSKPTA